ncbi:MAG: hypothetical protein KF799_00895 [Bdellovibrionales bacterium]|nr:hypothetical protein [Bdellovibrionales bacterium]
MRHNKYIGWDTFLGVIEQVQKVSPWLSRQMARRAADWPFWFSGLSIKEWTDRQACVHLPFSLRTSVDGELCQGHLLLGAELTLRLLLLRYRQEFPFRYRIRGSRVEVHHALDQAVDYKFAIAFEEWERLRLELASHSQGESEFVFHSYLADGRVAATFTFQVAFQLEKLLPA